MEEAGKNRQKSNFTPSLFATIHAEKTSSLPLYIGGWSNITTNGWLRHIWELQTSFPLDILSEIFQPLVWTLQAQEKIYHVAEPPQDTHKNTLGPDDMLDAAAPCTQRTADVADESIWNNPETMNIPFNPWDAARDLQTLFKSHILN